MNKAISVLDFQYQESNQNQYLKNIKNQTKYLLLRVPILGILILTSTCSFSQNLIGYHKDKVIEYMNERGCKINDKKTYPDSRYLISFSDPKMPTSQVYFFVPTYNLCYEYMLVIKDKTLKSTYIETLNTTCKKENNSTWIETRKTGEKYKWLLKEKKDAVLFIVNPIDWEK